MMTLRIGTWNCGQGLGKKATRVAELELDLLVVPECGRDDLAAVSAQAGLWCGENVTAAMGFSPWAAVGIPR